MIQKTAIAVFSPTNPVEATFQDTYHSACGKWMTMGQMKRLIGGLSHIRGIHSKVSDSPSLVAKLLVGQNNQSQYWYYPCDIVELRGILESGQLASRGPLTMFSPKVAKQLLTDYSSFLVFDKPKMHGQEINSVLLANGAEGEETNLAAIMIRDRIGVDGARKVYRIVKETIGHTPVHWITDIAGIEPRKVAMVDQEWKVTLPKFKIFEEKTNAPTQEAALQKVLNRIAKADKVDPNHPPDDYLAANYAKFMPLLVKPINSQPQVQPQMPTPQPQMVASNWYAMSKTAAHPHDFLVGKQPYKYMDPEIQYQKYQYPHKALSIKVNDLVGFRYGNLKLPVGLHVQNLPVQRSMLEKPTVGKVVKIDDQHLHILWDGDKDPKPFPMRHVEFLILLKDVV